MLTAKLIKQKKRVRKGNIHWLREVPASMTQVRPVPLIVYLGGMTGMCRMNLH